MSRTIDSFTRGILVGAIAILLGGALGCASMPGFGTGASGGKLRRIPLRVERPEAASDYDVLVAERAQAEGDFELARAAYQRAAAKDPGSAFIHERLSRLAWQLDDVDGAVTEAERAFELDPDSTRARLFLGRLYRLRRDFAGLDRVLRDEEGRPLDADAMFALYQVALEQQDYPKAEGLARALEKEEPDQLRGTLALASVYEQQQDFDAAESVVRRGLRAFPNHFLLSMRLAGIERTRGNRAGEIRVYRDILRSHPDHYGILQRLGKTQADGNDIDGAIVTFQRIVEVYPDDVNSLRRLASLEFSAGRYEAAARRLEGVLDRDPDQPDLAFALGQIRRAAGNPMGAVQAYNRITPKDTNYIDARVQIAAILESEGRADEALAEIERLRAIQPERQLDMHAASLRAGSGDLEGGIALLESLLDGSEADTDVYYQMGILHGTHGETEDAMAAMEQVLEADPNNASALNYIGYSWAERGENLEEAEELIRRAIELSPGDGYITDSLGWVYYKMAQNLIADARRDEALGFLDQAEEQLMQALELTGGDSVVSEHLGDVFLLRGDKSGALRHFEKAVELEMREEEQPDLMQKLETLRRELGLRSGRVGEAP
ncbi:MAG: tetratricopeptide repeat protein [Myxococcota bacterium]